MVRILAVTKSRHYALRIRGRSAGEKSRNAGDLFHGIPLSHNPTRRQRCGKVYGCLVEYPQLSSRRLLWCVQLPLLSMRYVHGLFFTFPARRV